MMISAMAQYMAPHDLSWRLLGRRQGQCSHGIFLQRGGSAFLGVPACRVSRVSASTCLRMQPMTPSLKQRYSRKPLHHMLCHALSASQQTVCTE